MNNQKYWAIRADQRMRNYMTKAEREYNTVAKAFRAASSEMEAEAKRVFQNFVQYSGVNENEARRLLQNVKEGPVRGQLRKIAYRIADPQKRQELLNIVSAPAYSYRLRRWDDLKNSIDQWLQYLRENLLQQTNALLNTLLREAYYRSVFEVQHRTGIGFSFSLLPESRVQQIMGYKWSGEHYSARIWANTNELAAILKRELLTGFLTGRSYAKTAKRIQHAMSSGSMQAKRLICTEANYIANQGELEGYRASGVKWYIYSATLDLRTSEICRRLDGKRYRVEEAQPGSNYPPMHPWCRSTTVAYFSDSLLKQMQRSARDPESGNIIRVPGNMSYSEWYREYVEKRGT